MFFIFNRNHNRTHLPTCRAVGMMNRDANEIEVEEPRGHLCKWCMGKAGKHQSNLNQHLSEPVES